MGTNEINSASFSQNNVEGTKGKKLSKEEKAKLEKQKIDEEIKQQYPKKTSQEAPTRNQNSQKTDKNNSSKQKQSINEERLHIPKRFDEIIDEENKKLKKAMGPNLDFIKQLLEQPQKNET